MGSDVGQPAGLLRRYGTQPRDDMVPSLVTIDLHDPRVHLPPIINPPSGLLVCRLDAISLVSSPLPFPSAPAVFLISSSSRAHLSRRSASTRSSSTRSARPTAKR
eukprot:364256-Chlamydomonas_euryale.AAC.9